jgi:hypothetical protein
MPVLDEDDLQFLEEQGYFVVSNAVPAENVESAARAIWDFIEMDSDDSASCSAYAVTTGRPPEACVRAA